MRHMWSVFLGCVALSCGSWCMAQVAVTTYHNDNYRSGANTNETQLTLQNVATQTFGKVAVFPVTGQVYAQPLYVPGVMIGGTSHNVVFIETEHDQAYAYDVNSGALLWHTSFLGSPDTQIVVTPIQSSDLGCGDMTPEIGISGTPAIDTSTNTIYMVALTKQYNVRTQVTTFSQTLYGLDLVNGQQRVAPRVISATAPGTGNGSVGGILTFDPLYEGQRTGLLLENGVLFVSWASHCDFGNYHGWLMSFNKTSLALEGVFVDTPNGEEGGFWASGSGPAADSAGSIYAPTGNGDFTGDSGGTDFGDSILRLNYSGGTFSLMDYFTPWDEQTLDDNDRDVASGGVTLLPDQPGAQYPHLLIQAGKEGTIDLINRDNMGHWNEGNDDQIVQTLPYAIGGLFGSAAFWNNYAYFGGINDNLKAFTYDPNAQQLSTAPTSESPELIYFPGPTPSISSNGTSNGIVWIIEGDGVYAVLRAYSATNLANELYNSEQNSQRDRPGVPIKFVVPTIADGHVFVGGQDQVAMYGLLH